MKKTKANLKLRRFFRQYLNTTFPVTTTIELDSYCLTNSICWMQKSTSFDIHCQKTVARVGEGLAENVIQSIAVVPIIKKDRHKQDQKQH